MSHLKISCSIFTIFQTETLFCFQLQPYHYWINHFENMFFKQNQNNKISFFGVGLRLKSSKKTCGERIMVPHFNHFKKLITNLQNKLLSHLVGIWLQDKLDYDNNDSYYNFTNFAVFHLPLLRCWQEVFMLLATDSKLSRPQSEKSKTF